MTEPDARTLELDFKIQDRMGAISLQKKSLKSGKKEVGQPKVRLQRLVINPCAATEIKGAMMRMLTRMHLEREFRF